MIPFSRPSIGQEEVDAVARVLSSGHIAQGSEVASFESEFAAQVGTPHAVAVSNGTVAIEIGLQAIGIGPGDEVVVPSLTFVATANAVRRVGAAPVFADIDPKTYCLTAATVEPLITERTRAVMVVHLYGHPADVDTLSALCDSRGVHLLEDAAQGIGAAWRGRPVGSFGTFGSFSLYATKNVTTGEGGMISTGSEEISDVFRSLRSHQNRLVDGKIQVASNARMTDVEAAIGRVQLARLPSIQAARHAIAVRYDRELDPAVTTPYVAPEATHAYHQYTIRVPDRDRVVEALREAGVGFGIYYKTPVHLTETYDDGGARLPDTETVAAEILSLPVRPDLTESEQDRVIGAVNGGVGL